MEARSRNAWSVHLLTKTYTKDGLVVFANVCTKEAASARVDGTAMGAIEVPTDGQATPPSKAPVDSKAMARQPTSPNYAGRTYTDFLAANSQRLLRLPRRTKVSRSP